MRIKLKDNKSIAFLDGSGEINTNDVMRQVLEVEPETPLVTGESLWIVYAASEFTYTGEILFQEEAGIYKMSIPEGVLKVPGEWRMQLFVRLYSTIDPTKYITQLSSDIALFTVQDGLPVEDGQPINNATVGNLWNETKKNAEMALNSAERAEAAYDQLINVDLPNKYVTVDTNQTISGNKTHTGINTFNGFTSINGVGIDADAIVKGSDRFKYPVKSGTLALTSDIPENIVTKDENGQIKVPFAPAQDDDATSKNYVDDADNTKLNKVEPFANGTYAYIVSKDDQFGTTNGYTEISETDKISTIVKRKTNGCIETRTPSADIEAANKGYVDTAISDTQGQLAQTNQNVEDLYTILEQAQVVTVTTLEQAYTARETAGGEPNLINGSFTAVKEIRGKTVAAENLIPYPYTETTKTMAGLTYTDNGDGSITVNGAPTDYSAFLLTARLELAGVFTLSGIPVGSNLTYTIGFRKSDGVEIDSKTGVNITFDTTDYSDYDYMVINIKRNNNNIAVNNVIVRPMLNVGTEAKPYSKWFAGLKNASFEKIVSTGRNLIPFPYYSKSGVINGITYKVNSDGSILLNGTATANSSFVLVSNLSPIKLDKSESYFLSGCPSGGGFESYRIFIQNTAYQQGYSDVGNGVSFTAEYTDYYIFIIIWEGFTVNNLVFSPMLNYGTSALPYEPYTSDTLSVETPIELPEYDVAYPETGETKRQSKTIVFDGTENWKSYPKEKTYFIGGLFKDNLALTGICNLYNNLISSVDIGNVTGIYLVYTQDLIVTDLSLNSVEELKAYLAAQSAAGNPLTVTYKTAESTTEATPFDKSKYIAWKNGSETIEQGANDNSEYGAENTVKQDYFTLTGGTTNV